MFSGKNSPSYGKIVSDETKLKISKSHSQPVEQRSIPDMKLIKTHRSIKDAAFDLRISGSTMFDPTGVGRAARGKILQYAGFFWSRVKVIQT